MAQSLAAGAVKFGMDSTVMAANSTAPGSAVNPGAVPPGTGATATAAIKKAVAVRKHLERNRQDKDSKFRLILVESRIHRLARYYRQNRKLSPNWKYESATASTLVA